jgi:hypothetical protein
MTSFGGDDPDVQWHARRASQHMSNTLTHRNFKRDQPDLKGRAGHSKRMISRRRHGVDVARKPRQLEEQIGHRTREPS